jgi:hypothetical protein
VKIAPFRIERYYAVHEFTAPYMLSSSDAESVAVADLLALEPDASERLGALHLGYTESPGAPELRAAIVAMFATTEPEDVVVVSVAEEFDLPARARPASSCAPSRSGIATRSRSGTAASC